jgi:hypothetical protein
LRGSEVKQGGQIGVETRKLQGGAHKLTQASHRRKPHSCDSSRRGQRRQEGPKRIHGPAFFPEGEEGNGWDRASKFEQKLADGFGPAGKRRVYNYAARAQTAKEVLERRIPAQFIHSQD